MESRQIRPARGRNRASRKQKFFNRPSHLTTPNPKISTESARRILNVVGLGFQQAPGTDFHRFASAGSQELEAAP